MKWILCVCLTGWFCIDSAFAQSPVTLTITDKPGPEIPKDFAGLSFGAIAEIADHGGVSGHLFNGTNTQLIMLFKNSGLHHLRLGGTTVEGTNAAVPDHAAIDDVFAFAKAADLKVMYSLRLLNGDAATAAENGKYIWEHYRDRLDYFAIGNEPDVKRFASPPYGEGSDTNITNYTSYLMRWESFAKAVTNVAPGAKFAGPDPANQAWAKRFAKDEKDSGLLGMITQHFYVGGNPYIHNVTNVDGTRQWYPTATAISYMMSPEWVEKYPGIFRNTAEPVMAEGFPFRMTEANDYLKGATNASDAFASALWALEFLHWWAAHGAAGVNFHNTEWLKTDTVYLDETGNYQIHPKAYGIKAFEVGSHGHAENVKMENNEKLNLAAYAVGDATHLYVTIINKEYGEGARDATVRINPGAFVAARAEMMLLRAPNGNVGATSGTMLAGAFITNNATWHEVWSPIGRAVEENFHLVTVPHASATLVKLSAR